MSQLHPDGKQSATRKAISDLKPFPSGTSSYRFTVDRPKVLKQFRETDPEAYELIEKEGDMKVFFATDRTLIVYPCRRSEVLSIACLHPDVESEGSSTEWNRSGDKQQMLKTMECFGPVVQRLLQIANPDSVKVWKLLDMAVLPTWRKGKLALLGDAAHPFLPHQGQGAAMAIEDAIALGIFLPSGTRPEDVPSRLALYEHCRKPRADLVQQKTRERSHDRDASAIRSEAVSAVSQVISNFTHNEFHHSCQVFRQFLASQRSNTVPHMPTAFGTQPLAGEIGTRARRVAAAVIFKTSRTLLENFFSSQKFQVAGRDTIVEAKLIAHTYTKVPSLGGRSYNTFGLYVPGVEYVRANSTVVSGTYPAVVLCDSPEAIVRDREEFGIPALFADLELKLGDNPKTMTLRASWEGTTFAQVILSNLQPSQAATSSETKMDFLRHKSFPTVGNHDAFDADYADCIPSSKSQPASSGLSPLQSSSAQIEWRPQDVQSLPTLTHVVDRLAELPVFEVVRATVIETVEERTHEAYKF